jgi:hypothetical protein
MATPIGAINPYTLVMDTVEVMLKEGCAVWLLEVGAAGDDAAEELTMDEREDAEEGEALLAGTVDVSGEEEEMDDSAAEELAGELRELDTAAVTVGEEEGPAALLAELLVEADAA